MNFDRFEVLTFDCYGTLIDWETGIWEALHTILSNHSINISADEALVLYGELEAQAELEKYERYKSVLKTVLGRFGSRLGFAPSKAELQSFAESVQKWPAFPDSAGALRALKSKYQLAIISNVDDDLFAFSAKRLGTQFDWIITAEQVRAYKPSLNNFHIAIDRIGKPRHKILHVAQSLYHDILPANSLGLTTVWINRRREKGGFGATPPAEAQPDLEIPDLKTLPLLMGLSLNVTATKSFKLK